MLVEQYCHNDYDINSLFCFYNSEYDRLVATGLYFKIDLALIKDMVHQLFLDFAEKKIDLKSVSNPQAYILTSLKRRIIDHFRHCKKNTATSPFIYCEISVPSINEIIEVNEASTEIIQKLKRAYEKLPERCRNIIFLKFYENLSNEEIVDRTGLSIRSVYNNLSEAIKLLRAEMKVRHKFKNIAVFSKMLPLIFPAL